MLSESYGTKTFKERPWIRIALIAALPLLLIQLVIMTSTGLLEAVVYFFPTAAAIIAGAWLIGLFVEIAWRANAASQRIGVPLFSIFAVPAFFLMFFAPKLAQVFLIDVPQVCRVSQIVRWQTSASDPRHAMHREFVLVLGGPGNRAQHQLDGGYLNWTGKGGAGFPVIEFRPMRLGGYQMTKEGTREQLHANISKSGLPATEVEDLCDRIWHTLTEIEKGGPVVARGGSVQDPDERVRDEIDTRVGGLIWTAGFLVAFGMIARIGMAKEQPAT